MSCYLLRVVFLFCFLAIKCSAYSLFDWIQIIASSGNPVAETVEKELQDAILKDNPWKLKSSMFSRVSVPDSYLSYFTSLDFVVERYSGLKL